MTEEAKATLLTVSPDGTTQDVENSYEGIKGGIGGGVIDLVRNQAEFAMFIDDNGMLDARELNVPASVMMGMALYGPIVLVAGEPDSEGETLPPPDTVREVMENLARRWKAVTKDLWRKGQRGFPVADPATIPPATVRSFTNWDEMSEFLFGEEADAE